MDGQAALFVSAEVLELLEGENYHVAVGVNEDGGGLTNTGREAVGEDGPPRALVKPLLPLHEALLLRTGQVKPHGVAGEAHPRQQLSKFPRLSILQHGKDAPIK